MNDLGDTPFKPGVPSPLLDIPGCGNAKSMQLDFCHAFHLGYGIDAAASVICLLVRLNHFGDDRKFDSKLKVAYGRYIEWCHKMGKTTSIKDFTRLYFDMASFLVVTVLHICGNLRNNDSPTSLNGKAYDTAVVLAWLQDEMAATSSALPC